MAPAYTLTVMITISDNYARCDYITHIVTRQKYYAGFSSNQLVIYGRNENIMEASKRPINITFVPFTMLTPT